ncbi:predicted protein [Chaetomium globosum CBS 148.51]|uniref:Uncharacterized protein n=1 Tax=Chaetomium globosum (strain ATCC 6205 / CBS 148.51 / DSM 1962 / NBRC 6347 / NRRL 1970) TaxID=306901 RepID=Q2GUW9_CHAGB|nr:uncharacterized protein CHGG_08235 [Chaetomium globosum CBS 148.51]EAQ86982.1 predicted protein [Chaetomium globosum CBS 148.51]
MALAGWDRNKVPFSTRGQPDSHHTQSTAKRRFPNRPGAKETCIPV